MEQKIKSLIETLEYELESLEEGMDGIDAFDHVAINAHYAVIGEKKSTIERLKNIL